MSKQFDPRRVLKQITNSLLRQFFTSREELLAVPWDTLKETDVQPIYDAWQALPEPQRCDVQVILQDVNELADDHALVVLADEVHERAPDLMFAFVAQDGRLDKAMWAYVHAPQAFGEAARFARADSLSTGRFWHKRNGLPVVQSTPRLDGRPPDGPPPLAVTQEMKASLAAALSNFYAEAQGRGQHCQVEHYRRSNGNEYFFVYLADYPDTHLSFDDVGAMLRHHERGAFDNVFVYRADAGTVETFVRGGRKVREPLTTAFCKTVLDFDPGPEQPGDEAAYRLDGLKAADFAFPTDPTDGVAEVRVRQLRLEVSAAPGRRITLEAGPTDRKDAVHRMLRDYLDQKRLPVSALRVTGTTLMLTFHATGGGRPRSVTFEVSYPSSCNLKSKSDEYRAIGERCLKRWGIARD